jgi:hypothetical protein
MNTELMTTVKQQLLHFISRVLHKIQNIGCTKVFATRQEI